MIRKSRLPSKLALAVRVISVPPVLVTAMMLTLYFKRSEFFRNIQDLIFPILFLGFIPLLAYPVSLIIPSIRKAGRAGQRNLAFVFSIAGYLGCQIWAFASRVSKDLLLICLSYFFSVVILTVVNKVIHIKASGHACSATGPLFYLVYSIGWKTLIPTLIIAALIAWSSVYLKRHTLKELGTGCLVFFIAFGISFLLISVL
ncbi:MAG: hypothetical protein HUJ76_00465 [Parasporobacterium sp.]|nr:hypothetical protein [Parasporobacterium sp.]